MAGIGGAQQLIKAWINRKAAVEIKSQIAQGGVEWLSEAYTQASLGQRQRLLCQCVSVSSTYALRQSAGGRIGAAPGLSEHAQGAVHTPVRPGSHRGKAREAIRG